MAGDSKTITRKAARKSGGCWLALFPTLTFRRRKSRTTDASVREPAAPDTQIGDVSR